MCRAVPVLALIAFCVPANAPAAPVCALVVQVVDEDGKAVADTTARVSVGSDVQTATTGKDGVAEWTALPCGEAVIQVGRFPREWSRAWSGTTRTLRPDVPATARIVVVARTEVTVRVMDLDRRPVSSGFVSVMGPGRGGGGSVDDKGLLVTWLEPGQWQFYWHGAAFRGAPPGPSDARLEAGTFAQVGRAPLSVDLVLQTTDRLAGRIVDPAGKPLEGIAVFARDPVHGGVQGSAASLADGRFEVHLRKLPTVLEPVSFGPSLTFDPPRLPVQEATAAPVEFVGRPGERPRLRGRVVLAGSGEPQAGAEVYIEPDCGGIVPEGLAYGDIAPVSLESGLDGSFEARCVPECPFKVTAHRREKQGTFLPTSSGSLDLPVGSCDRDLVLELERTKTWVLEGTVADRKGVPLEGLAVTLFHYYKAENRDAVWLPSEQGGRTGEGGRFRIEGQRAGRYRLEVDLRGTPKAQRDLVLVAKRNPGVRLEVALEDEDAKNFEVRAIPGATLCARAVDAKNAPVRLSSIALFAPDEDVILEDTRWHRPGPQEPGRVCLDGVIPGRYRVLLGRYGGVMPRWYPGSEEPDGAVAVEVSSGLNELEPVVMRPVGSLSLTLPGWSGPQPPGVELREVPAADAPPGAPSAWTLVPEDRTHVFQGAVTVHRIPAGRWEVRACADARCEKREETWDSVKPLPVGLRGGRVTEATLERTIQGTWIAEAAELGGKPYPDAIPSTMRLTIEGDAYTATVGNVDDRGTLRRDPTARPRTLDITGTEGSNSGKTFLAIYEREGDTLRICYDLSGRGRPADFATADGTQLFLVTYRRASSGPLHAPKP